METPIRVYTPYLDLKMEVDNYSSLQLTRDYHGVGTIELHINHYVHGADSIKKGDVISLGDSQDKVGIIRSREISLTEEGKGSEEWAFEAVTLQGLMQQRITIPPKGKSHDRKSGPAETVMKHYIHQNFVDPADSKREIKYLVIADDKGRGKNIKRESRYKNVADELEDMSKESNVGWMVYADYARRKFVFDVYEGLDLTQGNEEGNDPVFFSPEFGTIKSQDFSDSDLDMSNFGYIGGPGEGEERYVIEIGEKTGLNRFEAFVDARDVSDKYDEDDDEYDEDADEDSDDNKRPDKEIEADLEKRGKSKMEEKTNELSLEAEIISPTTRDSYQWQHEGYVTPVQPYGHYEKKEQQVTPFVYERDFDLGDIVPVYNRTWGVTMTAPITKIKEIHEPGGFRLDATFGKERPTLVSKIRDEFDEINGVDKQEAAAVMVSRHGKNVDKRLTEEQKERLKQAQENLDEARDYTENYAEKKVHVGDEPPDDTDKKWLDTSGTHDRWRRYNHESNAENEKDKWETDDVIDKDTTFADEWLLARHIESLNGLTVGGGQFEVDESGNVSFAGIIRGADGEFHGTVSGGRIETEGVPHENGGESQVIMEGGMLSGHIDKNESNDEPTVIDVTGVEKDSSENKASVLADDDEETNGDKGDDGAGEEEDDEDDDSGSSDYNPADYDTTFTLIPRQLEYKSPAGLTKVDSSGASFAVPDEDDDLKLLRKLKMTASSMFFDNGNGKPGIDFFLSDDRNVMVLRGEKQGKKYGSNIYLYGNNDRALPGALRFYDGTDEERLRIYKGYIYQYTMNRVRSKDVMSLQNDTSNIFIKSGGRLNFNSSSGRIIFSIRDDIGDDNKYSIALPNFQQYMGGSTGNLRVTSHGNIQVTKSSRDIKRNIETVTEEESDHFIENARPISFESLADEEEGMEFYGYIAEEMDEVDKRLTDYDIDGKPFSVNYDRVPSLLHIGIRKDRKRIAELEKENKKLKENMSEIFKHLEKLEENLAD